MFLKSDSLNHSNFGNKKPAAQPVSGFSYSRKTRIIQRQMVPSTPLLQLIYKTSGLVCTAPSSSRASLGEFCDAIAKTLEVASSNHA